MVCDVCGSKVVNLFYEVVDKHKWRFVCVCCMADLMDPEQPCIQFQNVIRRDYQKNDRKKMQYAE